MPPIESRVRVRRLSGSGRLEDSDYRLKLAAERARRLTQSHNHLDGLLWWNSYQDVPVNTKLTRTPRMWVGH
jgi:hypothetical protein